MKPVNEFLIQDEQVYSGAVSCRGCGWSLLARHLSSILGPNTVYVLPASCFSIITGPYPLNELKASVVHTLFAAAPATATGVRAALDRQGKKDTTVCIMAGDGGTFDIGFQCLSAAAERNEDMVYVCLDNEGYMNTGAQKSSATPRSARTGSTPAGKTSRKKNLVEIMAAHGVPYVATASVSHLDDLLRKVKRAREMRGLRLLHLLIPCLDGWGLAEDAGLITARAAVDCGAWPLVEVEDGEHWTLNSRRSRPLAAYLALQKRYRGLSPQQVAALQDDIDRGWQRLQRLQQLG